jgi:hypothetical protein
MYKGQRHGSNSMGLSMPTSMHHPQHHNTIPNFRMAHNTRAMGTGGSGGGVTAINTGSNNPVSSSGSTSANIGAGLPANSLAAAYVNQANYFAQSQMMMGAQQFAAVVAAAASINNNQPVQPSSTSPHTWMSGISSTTATTSTSTTPNSNSTVNTTTTTTTATATANHHTQRGNKSGTASMNTLPTQQHVNSNQSSKLIYL